MKKDDFSHFFKGNNNFNKNAASGGKVSTKSQAVMNKKQNSSRRSG